MKVNYTNETPAADDLYRLYDHEGWNDFLSLPKEALHQAMSQSWYVLSAYHEERLIGTGRIVSDGIINAYLCGLIVHSDYRNQGIGKEMVRRLAEKGRQANLHLELFSEAEKAPYYERLGFQPFAIGLKDKND